MTEETKHAPVGDELFDPADLMGDLAPTAGEIQAAAMKWCGDKDRETFASDAYYFRHNWSSLNGLKRYVSDEIRARADLAAARGLAAPTELQERRAHSLPSAVTDEMVDQGYYALIKASDWQDWEADEIKPLIRAALSAALSIPIAQTEKEI